MGRFKDLVNTDHFLEGADVLRDCPFCGARPQFTDEALIMKLLFGSSAWGVWCRKCLAATHAISRTKQEAAKKWNGINQ